MSSLPDVSPGPRWIGKGVGIQGVTRNGISTVSRVEVVTVTKKDSVRGS